MSTTETKPTEAAIVRYDGQEFSIDRTVAESDSHLRAALAGVYPSLATAAFSRATENGRLVVTATKTAGTKGAALDVAARLAASGEHVNPAIRVATRVSTLLATGAIHPARFARLEQTMRRAAERGSREHSVISTTLSRLRSAAPNSASGPVELL